MSDPVTKPIIKIEPLIIQSRVCYPCGREGPDDDVKALILGWAEDSMGGLVWGVMQGGSTRVVLCRTCRQALLVALGGEIAQEIAAWIDSNAARMDTTSAGTAMGIAQQIRSEWGKP